MENQKEMFDKTISRSPRSSNTREKTAARKPWAPPSMLDAPPAPDGYKHRWIRAVSYTHLTLPTNREV